MHDRRQILYGLITALGGGAVLASCDSGESLDDLLASLGDREFYSRRERETVELIADVVIPRTETPGAIDAGVPQYLEAMMSSWASDDTKHEQRRSLKALRDRLRELAGKDMVRASEAERSSAVAALDAEAFAENAPSAPESVACRFKALKSLIAEVYYSTEIGATQELHCELVPGRWLADVPFSEIGKTWAF